MRQACGDGEPVFDQRYIDPPLCGIANVASVIDREGLDAGTAGKFVEIRRDRHIFEETADRARSVEGSLRAPQHLDPGEVIWQEVDGEAPDRKSTRLNSSHYCAYRMPSSACKKKILNYRRTKN